MKDARLTGSFTKPKLSPRLTLQHRIPWCTLISLMINCCIENRRKGTFDKDETVKYRNQRCDWLYWLSWIRIMPQRNKVLADRSRLTAALVHIIYKPSRLTRHLNSPSASPILLLAETLPSSDQGSSIGVSPPGGRLSSCSRVHSSARRGLSRSAILVLLTDGYHNNTCRIMKA